MTTLDEIRKMIIDSDRDDWHDIIVGTYFTEVPDVDNDTFEWHHQMIVYRHDVDLTIQWGMDARGKDDIVTGKQLWREHGEFPDEKVRVQLADVFWRGNLIDRVELVTVDGGRALLPLGDQHATNYDPSKHAQHPPIEWEYTATVFEVAIARLLDGGRDFDRYFKQTTMTVKG